MSTSRIIRKFERFLFNGVPEQPESTFERDGNSYATTRETGRSSVERNSGSTTPPIRLGTFTYDLDEGTENYQEAQ